MVKTLRYWCQVTSLVTLPLDPTTLTTIDVSCEQNKCEKSITKNSPHVSECPLKMTAAENNTAFVSQESARWSRVQQVAAIN